ncbi:MAG: cyclic nucleotide-binding domain-containing protein [Ghiorsea sp.]|nr:cyclic nucleotide-binding domain-containing protein [Ghiorsea sp.]
MSIENIMEYSKKEVMVEPLIEANANFKAFYNLPLLAEMKKKHAMILFTCMTREDFQAGDMIYESGTTSAGKMSLILDGKVNVTSESGYPFTSLAHGDVFGLFSFLDENRNHSVTLTVDKDTVVLSIDRAYFDLIALEDPKLGNQLMRFMFRLLSKKASELEVEYAHMHHFALGGKV